MDESGLAQVSAALHTVHNPASASAQRHEAQAFLEPLKTRPDAALLGWRLAARPARPDAAPDNYVRHFGLALLEGAVAYQFAAMDAPQRRAVRDWIVQLAGGLEQRDPHFIREKVAYLWVAVAKRVWGIDEDLGDAPSPTGNDMPGGGGPAAHGAADGDGWAHMDTQLLEMWVGGHAAQQELVLSVLRNLFEDVYLLDDAVAARRAGVLSAQTIEIVASRADIGEMYAARAPQLERLRSSPAYSPAMPPPEIPDSNNNNSNNNNAASAENGGRTSSTDFGEDVAQRGWLRRWVDAVGSADERVLVRLIETIKATLKWVPVPTILSSDVLGVLVQGVKHRNVQVRALSCDALHILVNTRTFSDAQSFTAVVGTIFRPDGVAWLQEVYAATHARTAGPDEPADDMEYVFAKKFVELITSLGDFIENSKLPPLPDDADLRGYFKLMLEICRHPSLMVSGLVLQFWCSVLRVEKLARKSDVEVLFPPLLSIAAERCISYEDLPGDHLSCQYMDMDFDATSEKKHFSKSYQRYMEDVLRLIVCRIPVDGMQFLHEGMIAYFQTPDGWQTMNAELADHSTPAFVLGSAQLLIVESAIRGVSRWQLWATPEERAESSARVLGFIALWAEEMLALRVVDLVLQRRVVECLVQFAPLLRDNDDGLLLKILERVLESCTHDMPPETPEYDVVREKVTELRMASGTELNRLAYMVPESLAKLYDDLERVIGDLVVAKQIREHESVSFKSFLLVVSQRSSMPHKAEKFSTIVDPVLASWTDETTMKGLTDLEWFMERVGVVQIDQYFRQRGITAATNLLEAPMDDAGRALKAELKQKWQAIFPIRPSRIFIQYTIERLDHRSDEYRHLLALWKPRIQAILPHILQLITQIMAYHNPANWTQLPAEVQTFVRTSCTERFWQVGISMQTKDEFESANQAASRTLRDFADSVGHIVRYTREYTFLTLGSISQLEETMYEIPGIGARLCEALASTTAGITSHAWRHMISLTVRNVVRNCPLPYIASFLTEFLPPFLATINKVLVEMWTRQEASGFQLEEEGANNDDLSEEMMEEHLLRQLTAIVDRLLIDLVGQSTARTEPSLGGSANTTAGDDEDAAARQRARVRQVCRNTPVILVEVLLLAKNVMVFKDSRCCFNTCLIVRHLLAGPPIEILDEIAPVLVTEIMPACLRVLADAYFAESHVEAGTILTLIFAQLPATSPSPMQQLAALLGGLAPPQRLHEFGAAMDAARSLRQQRGIFMDFLAQCRVLELDQQARNRTKKRAEQQPRLSMRNQPEDHLDSLAMTSMFGQS